MTWRIEFSPKAEKAFRKLDVQTQSRVKKFLYGRLLSLPDPRKIGKRLQGDQLGQFWAYRVGDYRVIAEIRDGQLLVLIVGVGPRDKIYG
ncbi:MAG: type II toxin-antitoxin system RelE/ParE family toxin [Litorimonas sp.]